jgi:hypothetical protein
MAALTLNAFLAASVPSGALHKSLIKEYLFITLMIVRLQVAGFEAWQSAFDERRKFVEDMGGKSMRCSKMQPIRIRLLWLAI